MDDTSSTALYLIRARESRSASTISRMARQFRVSSRSGVAHAAGSWGTRLWKAVTAQLGRPTASIRSRTSTSSCPAGRVSSARSSPSWSSSRKKPVGASGAMRGSWPSVGFQFPSGTTYPCLVKTPPAD